MGRMNVTTLRYLEGEHFRVLVSVEMGMKNHEVVPLALISAIAGIHRGAVSRTLKDLCKQQLCSFERSKKYDGYRLTIRGYDYLALRALCAREVVGSVGNQIGIGKESDVYIGGDMELNDLCLKFHRLGRTSFRKVKDKRDYHNKRKSVSWLYLSRLAAAKEFAFLKALHENGFPVPCAVDLSRHVVVMEFIIGKTLCNVQSVSDPGALYSRCMSLIMKLARHGLIHSDFNEFNIILVEDDRIILIDFPQMVSIDHANAEFYFDRDVDCIRTFFKRKFDYESEEWPKFSDIERKSNMDVLIEASGFTKMMQKDLNKAYDEGNFHLHNEEEEQDDEGEDNDDEEEEKPSEDETEQGEEEKDDSDSSLSVVKEEAGDVDKEEVAEHEAESQQQKIVLSKSLRFNDWLDKATSQIQDLDIKKYEDECFDDAIPKGAELELAMPSTVFDRKTDPIVLANNGESENEDEKGPRQKVGAKANSVASSLATFTPEEIKKRVILDKKRNKEKTRLKVKGKQSAVNRGRKENRDVIGEYSGWI